MFGDPKLKVDNAERMQDVHVDMQPDIDGSDNRAEEANLDIEENRLDSDVPPSRNISLVSGQVGLDSPSIEFSNSVSSFDSDLKTGGVWNINPNQSLIQGRVYSIVEDLELNPSSDDKVLLKA